MKLLSQHWKAGPVSGYITGSFGIFLSPAESSKQNLSSSFFQSKATAFTVNSIWASQDESLCVQHCWERRQRAAAQPAVPSSCCAAFGWCSSWWWAPQPAWTFLKQLLVIIPSAGKQVCFHSRHEIKGWSFCTGCVLLCFQSILVLFILLPSFLLILISSDFSQMLLRLPLILFPPVLEIFPSPFSLPAHHQPTLPSLWPSW